MKFTTKLVQGDGTAVGMIVPAAVVDALGKGKRPPVRVTINGYTYRNTVAVMGGQYMVGVSAEHRKGAGVAGGDEVEVDLELDDEPRVVEVPPDFASALAGDSAAKQFFDGLSYSKQRWFVLGIEYAKTPETRQRRIDKAVAQLREGRSPR